MTGTRPADILRHLAGPDAHTPDADLHRRFTAGGDGAAFAELVRRHGPVVLATCRRMLGHHDADDAFQAVFLVLARRPKAVGNPERMGNWLYGVAVRVSLVARRAAARRRRREVQVAVMPDPPTSDPHPDDLGSVLDQELARLPVAYREAIVLCDVRGESRAAAAQALRIPEGTLSSRLNAGRKRLADRLARRGVTLAAVAVPGASAAGRAIPVPDSLLNKTHELLTGRPLPAAVLRLAHRGLPVRTMTLLTALTAALVTGAVFAVQHGDEPRPKSAPAPAPVAEDKPASPVTYRFAPRPSRVADLPVKDIRQVLWSPDGERLVVVGTETVEPPERKGFPAAVITRPFARSADVTLALSKGGTVVGFMTAKSGPAVLTGLREFHLVSGLHRLEMWDLNADPPIPVRRLSPDRAVNLDPVRTRGYALTADGTSFRTVYQDVQDQQPVRQEVREVSVESGRTVRTPLRVPGWVGVLDRRGDRLFVAGEVYGRKKGLTMMGNGLATAYDVGSGKKLWSREFGPMGAVQVQLGPAPDGALLVVARSNNYVSLVDGVTGQDMPPLEELVAPAECFDSGPPAFSAGNRLLAMCVIPLREGGATQVAQEATVRVWDTRTGKLVQRWDGMATVAFHPKRPVLAVLEQNGDQTRLGLWDFTQE